MRAQNPIYLATYLAAFLAIMPVRADAVGPFTVPDMSNPWLAGMPDGSTAGQNPGKTTIDTAPAQSPVLVNIALAGGDVFTFLATGTVRNKGSDSAFGPDGEAAKIVSRTFGAENGIADLDSPLDALIGVFLNNTAPSFFNPPAALDFTSAASRDFLTLSPMLRQPFFIGDGVTSTAVTQQFVAPAGATRLFLGTMDAYGWANNVGSFSVTAVPEPASFAFFFLIAPVAGRRQKKVSLQS